MCLRRPEKWLCARPWRFTGCVSHMASLISRTCPALAKGRYDTRYHSSRRCYNDDMQAPRMPPRPPATAPAVVPAVVPASRDAHCNRHVVRPGGGSPAAPHIKSARFWHHLNLLHGCECATAATQCGNDSALEETCRRPAAF
jgi:hypothetical protein